MHNACLQKAPLTEQAFCLQIPGHPGTHQAYVKDSLIEWEVELFDPAASMSEPPSSVAA